MIDPTHDTSRRDAIEARLQWVERARGDLSRTARRMPWLLLSAVAAVPAWMLWGTAVAAAVLAMAVALPAMAVYLVWSHRAEYAAERETLRRALADLDDPARAAPRSTPWRVPGKPLYL